MQSEAYQPNLERDGQNGYENAHKLRKTLMGATVGLLAGVSMGLQTDAGALAVESLVKRDEAVPSATAEPFATDSDAVKTVERNLVAPQPTDLPRFTEDNANGMGIVEYDKVYQHYAAERAEANGLHLADPEASLEAVLRAKSNDEIMTALNGYTEQLGFEFTFDTHVSGAADKLIPVDYANLDPRVMRVAADRLIRQLHVIPKEVFELADLKHFCVAERLTDEGDIGETFAEHQAICVTMDDLYNANYAVIGHELGHALDFALLGDNAWDDSEYMKHNPTDFRYGDENSPNIKITVAYKYGANNVVEDKGVMFGNMLSGLNPALMADQGVLGYKYRLLLGRLEEKIPGISKYLSEISGRVDDNYKPQYDDENLVSDWIPTTRYENEQLEHYLDRK